MVSISTIRRMILTGCGMALSLQATIPDGNFESGTPGRPPEGWETVISHPSVRFTPVIATDAPYEGSKYLKITTDYTAQPQVYGCLKFMFPCEPMTEYHVQLTVRSHRNDGGSWFGGGRNWAWVNPIPLGEYDWTMLNGWYRTGPDETTIPFMLHVNGTTELDFDALTITRVGPASDPTVRPTYTALDRNALEAAWRKLHDSQPARRARLEALARKTDRVDYPQVKLAYLDAFLPIVEKRMKEDGFELACTVMLDEMDQLTAAFDRDLAKLESDPEAYPTVPRYRTGPVIPDGYAMTAEVFDPATGKTGRRSAILNGFGHFFSVSDGLEYWPERGCNIIQIEQGPQCMERDASNRLHIKPEIFTKLVDTFRRAADANVSVILLLSPHYLPNEANGIWYGDEPGPWEYYRAYLGELLPAIKDFPSLHSITMTNEPHCFAGPGDPSLEKAWREFLKRRYPDVAALNRAYGTAYKDRNEVPLPSAELDRNIVNTPLSPVESLAGKFSKEQRPWLYDYVQCKAERFAAWHRRMADLIKEFAPGLPVHAKITGGYYMGHPVADGIDFELFSDFTDYHGFDDVGGVRIIHDWAGSLKPMPAVNTENHLLQPDYTFDRINHERVYADLFAQAMHGQTASVTWVYEPWYDPLATNTYSMRPAGMEAVSRAGMDLMRVAPELAELQYAPRQAAILTSPLSWWYCDRSHTIWRGSWSAFYDSGLRVGLLTEKQLARGDFGDTRVLILPETPVLEPETLRALRDFTASGGTLIAVGELPHDFPGWAPIPADELPKFAACLTPTPGWEKELVQAVRQAGVRPAIQLEDSTGNAIPGVHYLNGKSGEKMMTVAVNAATGKEISVTPVNTATNTPYTKAYDALTDRNVTFPFRLAPNQGAVWIFE